MKDMLQDNNLKIKEHIYRDIDLPSYSMLASISKHGLDIMTGVKSQSFNLKFGSLVDDLCFEPDRVADKYHQGRAPTNPTANVKKVLDLLLTKLKPSKTHNPFVKVKQPSHQLKDHISELMNCVRELGIYKSYTDDKIFNTINSKGKLYFKDKIQSSGKMMITKEMWDNAQAAAQTLKNHPFSRKCFEKRPGVELFYQFKFRQHVFGYETKGMLDCVIVDHNLKAVYPIDLKTGELPVNDFPFVMLNHKYYIQAGLYREALINMVGNDRDMTGYRVEPFEFLYISKENLGKPMIFIVPEELHEAALTGFTDTYGVQHLGVETLLEMYYGCKAENNCIYTEQELLDGGRVLMNNIIRK